MARNAAQPSVPTHLPARLAGAAALSAVLAALAACGGPGQSAARATPSPTATQGQPYSICQTVINAARATAPWIGSKEPDPRVDAEEATAKSLLSAVAPELRPSLNDAVVWIRQARYNYAAAVLDGESQQLAETSARHALLQQLATDEAKCQAALASG